MCSVESTIPPAPNPVGDNIDKSEKNNINPLYDNGLCSCSRELSGVLRFEWHGCCNVRRSSERDAGCERPAPTGPWRGATFPPHFHITTSHLDGPKGRVRSVLSVCSFNTPAQRVSCGPASSGSEQAHEPGAWLRPCPTPRLSPGHHHHPMADCSWQNRSEKNSTSSGSVASWSAYWTGASEATARRRWTRSGGWRRPRGCRLSTS